MSYNRQTTIICENNEGVDCTVQAALSLIGGKWKLKIYKSLRNGEPVRFSSLCREIGHISEKTLTAQLREMENDGIIQRTVYAEIPPRVEYTLSPLGYELEEIYKSLDSWGAKYIATQKDR